MKDRIMKWLALLGWMVLALMPISAAFGCGVADNLPPGVGALQFTDNFSGFTVHSQWQPGDKWEVITPGGTLPKVGQGGFHFREAGSQWWVNPFNANTPISGIYGSDANGLVLAILNTPPAYQTYINNTSGSNLPYVGALLNSYNTSYQKYGYWQITLNMQKVPGLSFQEDIENVQITGTYPPEIDFRISIGPDGTPTILYEVATAVGQHATYTTTSYDVSVNHTYGWKWASDFITFYIDGTQVFRVVTPANENYTTNPMFMYLLSGANYIGNGNPASGSLPAYIHVSNVSVYALSP